MYAKRQFQNTRNEGWESLLNDVKNIFEKHDIDNLSMDELAPLRAQIKWKCKLSNVTIEHCYHANIFIQDYWYANARTWLSLTWDCSIITLKMTKVLK